MSILAAGALVSGGLNLAKGLFGAIQTAKATQGINKLLANAPQYKRPEEYATELAYREKQASQSQPAWMRQATSNIGGAFATGVGNLKEAAISSNTLNRGIGDLFEKQINAYQDLGMQAEQWQEKQKENYMSTLQRGAGYSDTEYQENVLRPWEVKMNQFQGQKQAGAGNLMSGLEGMAGSAMNYVGTQYYADIMKGLQKTT